MALKDIAGLRAAHESTVLHPHANQTARLVTQPASGGALK